MASGKVPEVVPRLAYLFCPMCTQPLVDIVELDGAVRRGCTCGWIHYPANVLGVNVIATTSDDTVAVIYPGGADGTLAALPSGVIEYSESPEEAARRETFEETGLAIERIAELGRYVWRDHPYGPMLSFVFHAHVSGGEVRGSHEGRAALEPIADVKISPLRFGSTTAWRMFNSTR
jgi:ADP-ribose pyrophosphatase YjhB (NUDIX family)